MDDDRLEAALDAAASRAVSDAIEFAELDVFFRRHFREKDGNLVLMRSVRLDRELSFALRFL